MEYGKTADIPIRHLLTNYVCTISYNPKNQSFDFVSARYANSKTAKAPKSGFELYRRILIDPTLRANLIEALLPDQQDKIKELRESAITKLADNYGLVAGLVVFGFTGILLYEITLMLTKSIGRDYAESLTFLPAFFAIFAIFPTQEKIAQLYKRLYCHKNNHYFEFIGTKDAGGFQRCKRCGFISKNNDETQQ